MITLKRGGCRKISDTLNPSKEIAVEFSVSGPAEYDFCCFGVDSRNKLTDDRYMIFYNQTNSPNNEIIFSQGSNSGAYLVNLERLPVSIVKLVFTVSIDGNGTMGSIGSCAIKLFQDTTAGLHFDITGKDFQDEKAIIAIELYKKDVWRIAATSTGFYGGLSELKKNYSGEEIFPPSKLSLEKKLAKEPILLSLAKPLALSLEKHNLTDCIARVALVLDISGSMYKSFLNGTVKKIVDMILPVAVQFDDDGELDFWYYGNRPERIESINLYNYQNAVPEDWDKLMAKLGYGNDEYVVMKEIIDEYQHTEIPAYVIFITDGSISDSNRIKTLLINASKFPIFWQFVGVSGSGYGVLEELDTMQGRYVDNANFFALDDFNAIDNAELYDRLLAEFPQWLKEIKEKGMINS